MPRNRRWDPWPVGLFVVALVLRGIHLGTIVDSPLFARLGLDPLAYDAWGRAIASGQWLGSEVFYQDPLYPYLLGVLYATFGHHYVVPVSFQLVLGSLVAPVIYALTRTAFDRTSAAVAGTLAAVYLPSIYYEGLILKTSIGLFLIVAAMWLLSRALSSGRVSDWLLCGFTLGLACLVRGNLLLVVPMLVVWLLFDPVARSATGGSPLWKRAAALGLGVVIVLSVTTVRNRVVGGEWVLTTAQAGQNFYLGNNRFARTGEYDRLPFVRSNPKHERADFLAEAERRVGRSLTDKEASGFWFRTARNWIRSDPGAWAQLTFRKFRVYWGAYEVPDNLDYYHYREGAPVLRLPLAGFGLVVPLGVLGVVLAVRRPGWPRALVLLIVVYSTSVVLFFVFARYRMAMIPALLPFAGYGASELVRRASAAVRGRDARGPALATAGLAIVLFAFVNLPVRAPTTHWLSRVATTLGLPVRVETTATAHYNLGLLYAKEGDLERAEEELRAALSQETRYATVYVELGKVLARGGKNREAIEMYLEAIRLEPNNPRTYHVLGLLYRRVGDLDDARAAFREALRRDPKFSASAKELESLPN